MNLQIYCLWNKHSAQLSVFNVLYLHGHFVHMVYSRTTACVCVDVLACSMPLPQRCAWYGEWFVGSCIFYHLYSLWFSSIIQRLLLLRAVLLFAALFCSLLKESVGFGFVCIATFGSMYFLLLKS